MSQFPGCPREFFEKLIKQIQHQLGMNFAILRHLFEAFPGNFGKSR